MKKYIFLIFTALICLQPMLHAQENSDEALAAEYYRQGQFDKAVVLYKKLFDQKPENNYYYDGYFNSLIQLKDYTTAEKELKKIIRRNKDKTFYKVDLGYVYKLEGDQKKAKETYLDIINTLSPSEDEVKILAAAFQRREEPALAIETYLKARKLFKNNNLYQEELGSLYRDAGNYEAMFGEYVGILEANPYAFESIKNKLQDLVMQDAPYEVFRKILLRKIQAQPDNAAFTELLNWLFIQRKDFNAAFIQTKALDKRLKEGGRRLVELARIASNNGAYDIGEKIYQAVIEQGPEATYYIAAKRGLLDITYEKITHTGQYTDQDVQILIQSYSGFLATYGLRRPESAEVVLRLAEIQALYAHDVKSAISLLEKFEGVSGINNYYLGQTKLALGDYYLLIGQGWESTLYYGQVEKMFKDNPLGHEAKFRNAKLSFYRGDFEWAKAQLDVLKSSTSELIANNAMQLALLIQDNLGLDSTVKPLQLYADADFLIYKNKLGEAIAKLDSINVNYPAHSLSDEVLMARADIAFKKRNYDSALKYYAEVYTNYGKDILADDALFKAAKLEDYYLNHPDKAKLLYEKLLLEHTGSVYAVEARDRYRILRGDIVN